MKWMLNVRETGLVEWVCEHGVGHPDYISACAVAKAHPEKGHSFEEVRNAWLVHGCDGCCAQDDFPGKVKRKFQVWITLEGQGIIVKNITDDHLLNIKTHLARRKKEVIHESNNQEEIKKDLAYLTKWEKRIQKELIRRNL